jgi:hypothetical protein
LKLEELGDGGERRSGAHHAVGKRLHDQVPDAAVSAKGVIHVWQTPVPIRHRRAAKCLERACPVDRDPYKLIKQPFVCLRLGWQNNEPGGSEFDRVYVGLVLQPVIKVGMSRAQRMEMALSLAPEGLSINRHPGMFFRRVGTFEVASGNRKYNRKVTLLRCILV